MVCGGSESRGGCYLGHSPSLLFYPALIPIKGISFHVCTNRLPHQVVMDKQPLGDLGTLAVEFQWPYEVTNGKWLLYLTKIVVKGDSETECNPGGVVNNLTVSLRLRRCSSRSSHLLKFRPRLKQAGCTRENKRGVKMSVNAKPQKFRNTFRGKVHGHIQTSRSLYGSNDDILGAFL